LIFSLFVGQVGRGALWARRIGRGCAEICVNVFRQN
jgi:hypothetical protein